MTPPVCCSSTTAWAAKSGAPTASQGCVETNSIYFSLVYLFAVLCERPRFRNDLDHAGGWLRRETFDIELRLAELRLGLGKLTLGLVKRRLEGTRIDLKQ